MLAAEFRQPELTRPSVPALGVDVLEDDAQRPRLCSLETAPSLGVERARLRRAVLKNDVELERSHGHALGFAYEDTHFVASR